MPSVPSATVTLEVPFHDVDSMGIVWHGHYVKYLEIARTALVRRMGIDLQVMQDSGFVWPVVTCELKYIRPLRYGQTFQVEARLLEYENRLKIGYLITDLETGAQLTKGTTVQLALDAATGEVQFESPAVLLEGVARLKP